MCRHPEVLAAINEIVNEAIVVSDDDPTVQLNLEELEGQLPPQLMDAMQSEFEEIERLLEFNVNAYEVFKRWYVDGRIYFHVIIDKDAPQLGIRELRYVDPRKIKKVKEVIRKPAEDGRTNITLTKVKTEYFVYSERGYDSRPADPAVVSQVGIRIARDAVAYCTSGILDETNTMVLSHLHPAIRPLNMLRTMEDSAVIYRLVRAPERRIWYIDVGNLPKSKAEQVMYDMMTRHKTKLVYDPGSGLVKDQRNFMQMMEDIWLSRREGNRGTQVDTLPGAQVTGVLDEVNYFLKKLYKSLSVPIGRLEPELMYSLGRPGEITREEIGFSKFIDRVRTRFCELFLELLEKQLILKGYVSPEEWDQIRPEIKFKWASDNYWSELKEQDILMQRLNTLQLATPYIGRMFSNYEMRKTVLKQSDDDIEQIDEQILQERTNPVYMVPVDPMGQPIEMEPGLSPGPTPPAPKSNKK